MLKQMLETKKKIFFLCIYILTENSYFFTFDL